MPNHVTNILTINGTPDQVKTIRDAISNKSKTDNILIDFEKIIAMPTAMQGIHSGYVTIDEVDYENWREVSKTTGKVILDSSGMDRDDIKNVGLTAAELRKLKKEYGATNWYDWNIAHWGTKWNAYDQADIQPNSFKFDTAWSTPMPVIEALSTMFPDVTFEVDYADEDIGHNVGRYVFMDGKLLQQEEYSRSYTGFASAIKIKYNMSPLAYLDDRASDDPEYAKELAERYGIRYAGNA